MAKEKKIKETPLSRNLRTLLQLHRVSVAQMARTAGVGSSTVADWLKGRSATNFKALKALATAYGTNLDELLTGTVMSTPTVAPTLAHQQPARLTFEGQTYVSLSLIIPANFQPLDHLVRKPGEEV